LEEVSEWSEKIGVARISEKITKFKELIESYKDLKKKRGEKEELEQQLRNKREAFADARERYNIFSSRRSKLIQEQTQQENLRDNTLYSIQTAKEEIKENHERKKRTINIQEKIARLTKDKAFIEVALGKDPENNSEEEKENKEKEPHEVLGIDKDASLADIKRAYRKLSLK
jgi:DNA repair exonuclease SbcCD ATPase subunit